MRSHLDSVITENVLSLINDERFSSDLVMHADSLCKNVCAKVSVALSDDIDRVVSGLGISKRRFLEAAFIDAVEAADEIARREGLFEVFSSEQK
jgi:hypothetical protein